MCGLPVAQISSSNPGGLFNILSSLSFFFIWMQKTSFMLFLNKFDIFEKKVLNVRVNKSVYGFSFMATN